MKRNFLTLLILVLVIAFATCFMITGCQKPQEETPKSSKTEKLSIPESIDDGSNDPGSVTSTPDTPTSEDQGTTSSNDPGTTSSDDPVTSSSDEPVTSSSDEPVTSSSDEPSTSSSEEVRPSDTPIYNSAN